MTALGWRKWIAFGTGLSLERRGDHLLATLVRVRPGSVRVLGQQRIENVEQRPADDWVAEYRKFLRKHGASHVPATLLLPRRDVIVRVVALPGVADRDLDAAVRLQLDTLHPFPEEEVAASWARIGQTSSVLVAIAKRDLVDRYAGFAQAAGIRVRALMPSAAAIYAALRLNRVMPEHGFLALAGLNGRTEFYGESESRPLFSVALFDPAPQAVTQALSELRLPPDTEVAPLSKLLPVPKTAPAETDFENGALGYASALASAVPFSLLPVDLLPAELRFVRSRLVYAPTFALLAILAVLLGWLLLLPRWQQRDYLKAIEAELARIEPRAQKSAGLEKEIQTVRARSVQLDQIRQRTKSDLDVLLELNKLLPPPAWVNSLELNRNSVSITGESDQAAALLQQLDQSPLFQNAEFTSSPTRSQSGQDLFRVRAVREAAP
jgi:Tfp pilus assembly protein PilN